jgi:zinc protease
MTGKRILGSIFLFLMAFGLLALSPEQAAQRLPQDPDLISGRLANGLSYYILQNPKPENRLEMRLYVNAGSVNEDDDQRGLAHFTEHMAFNGTKSFAKSEVVDYLSSIGMGYMNGLNAGTSYEFTYYMLKVPTDDVEKMRTGFKILSEMAHAVAFEEDELERERGIILEEWRLGQGPQQRVGDATMEAFFAGSKYAERSPIGIESVLRNFELATIKRYYSDWYHPANQSVILVGDHDPAQLQALVEEFFGSIPAKENPRVMPEITVPENIEPQVVIVTDPEFPYNMAQITWKREVRPTSTVGDYYQSLKEELYCDMLSTRLEELSKKPNPSFSFAALMNGNLLKSLGGTIGIAITPGGKAADAVQTILTEARRVELHGFSEGEFERAKTKLTRKLQQAVDQKATRMSESLTWSFISLLNYGDAYMSPEQERDLVNRLLEGLTLEELNSLGHSLFPDTNLFVSLTAPESAQESLPSEEALLALINEAKDSTPEAYEDKVLDKPLIAKAPKAGTIRKRLVNRQAGIKTWVLSNGIRVHSKKTDFRQDEVILTAWSPGGSSQLEEADLPSANVLGMYMGESGVGEMDAMELQRATVGKVARARITMGLEFEGFRASCSPTDLELMFQLIHQYATNPRFDEEAFDSFIDRMASMLENSLKDPQTYFFDQLSSAIYKDNPYQQSIHPEQLQDVDLQRLESIFADRFADFSDFQFVIVGNFDEDELMRYVRTYLGSLPGTNRKEKFQDHNIRPFSGVSEVRFERGIGDRCFASIVTTAPYRASLENRVAMQALFQVYNERLRENVREELSGVYVVQAWPEISRYPSPHMVTNVLLACDPARVDELLDAVLDTANEVITGEFADHYVSSARATLQNIYADRIKTNSYWVDGILFGITEDRALDTFLDYPEMYQKIDAATIANAAKQWLRYDKNMLKMIMLPEASEKCDEHGGCGEHDEHGVCGEHEEDGCCGGVDCTCEETEE